MHIWHVTNVIDFVGQLRILGLLEQLKTDQPFWELKQTGESIRPGPGMSDAASEPLAGLSLMEDCCRGMFIHHTSCNVALHKRHKRQIRQFYRGREICALCEQCE